MSFCIVTKTLGEIMGRAWMGLNICGCQSYFWLIKKKLGLSDQILHVAAVDFSGLEFWWQQRAEK